MENVALGWQQSCDVFELKVSQFSRAGIKRGVNAFGMVVQFGSGSAMAGWFLFGQDAQQSTFVSFRRWVNGHQFVREVVRNGTEWKCRELGPKVGGVGAGDQGFKHAYWSTWPPSLVQV